MSRVLLLSTYELGAQPLGLAWPAAALADAGHEVHAVDLAVEDWPDQEIAAAEAIAFSVPMHTAARLSIEAAGRVRAARPGVPLAFYGLYAGVVERSGIKRAGDCCVAGEPKAALLSWLEGSVESGTTVELGPASGVTRRSDRPERRLLAPMDRYARLLLGEEELLVGTVESTRGCNHTCRHCPVPVVYGGRSRPLDQESVISDIDGLVERGAGHIRFADPDFLNRPAHAVSIATALHQRHPAVSFDATIKVSHLLRHRQAVADLAGAGLCFVVSAFESTSERVLELLDKHHTKRDASEAVALLRGHGIEIRPSFLPFTPWTERRDIIEILDFVAENDLVPNVDAVQYSIRLLVPPGSLVYADDPTLDGCATGFDEAELGYRWKSKDPALDELQARLAAVVEEAARSNEEADATYERLRAETFSAFGERHRGRPAAHEPLGPAAARRPRLSEPWFCCAEPTSIQLSSVTGR